MRFPPHPIRDVSARFVKQTCGGSHYAVVTVDFEPRPGAPEGLSLVLPGVLDLSFGRQGGYAPYQVVFGYLDALADGMREALAGQPGVGIDTTVFLRRLSMRRGGSTNLAFRMVGYAAARTALERAFGGQADDAAADGR